MIDFVSVFDRNNIDSWNPTAPPPGPYGTKIMPVLIGLRGICLDMDRNLEEKCFTLNNII